MHHVSKALRHFIHQMIITGMTLSAAEEEALPTVKTDADVVAFYDRFGKGSSIKFFN
jgi:hypothetical protein